MTNHLKIVVLACVLLGAGKSLPAAQVSDERTINRYISLLEKRPAPGTAFDRVYLHYKGSGALDILLAKLEEPSDSPQLKAARQLLAGMVYLREGLSELATKSLQRAARERSTDALVDQLLAQAWLQQSRYSESARALESAITKTDNRKVSFQLVTELVSIYRKLRQPNQAIQALEKFDTAFPGDDQIQNLLATTMIDAGRSGEAIAKLETLIAASRDPEERLKLETQRADVLHQIGKTQEAVSAYSGILKKLNPESWQAEELDRKIRDLLARQPSPEQLELYLKKQVEDAPPLVANRIHLIEFLHREGRYEESLAVASDAPQQQASAALLRSTIPPLLALGQTEDVILTFEALESSGQLSPDDVIRWSNLLMEGEDENPALKATVIPVLEKLLSPKIGVAPVWQRRARLAAELAKAGLLNDAAQNYEIVVQSVSADETIFQDYASLLFRSGNSEKAKHVLQSLVTQRSTSETAFKLSIETLREFNETHKAVTFATELVNVSPRSQHRLLLAELLLTQGQFADADQHMASLLKDAQGPRQKAVREQLVDLLLKTDSVGKKFRQLKQLLQPTDSELLLLTHLAEAKGDLPVAMQTVQQLPETSPLKMQALELQARLQQKAGQLDSAKQTYQQLVRLDPRQAPTYLQFIQDLQLQMGRSEEAYETSKALFQQSTPSAASVSRFVTFLKNSQRQNEAISVLSDFVQQPDTSAATMVDLADLLAEQFQSEEAMNWLWKAVERSGSEAQQRDITSRLVMLGLRTNRTEVVLQRLKSTISQRVSQSRAHRTLLMADAYRQARQLSDAVRELQAYLRVDSSHVATLTELVDLLSELNRQNEAVTYQLRLAEYSPTAEVFERLGDLLRHEKSLAPHSSQLNRIAQYSEWQQVCLTVVDSWLKQERPDDAEGLLQSLEGTNVDVWEVSFRRVQIALWRGDVERAISLCHQQLQTPAGPAALLELATTSVDLKSFNVVSHADSRAFAWRLLVSPAADQQFPLSSLLKDWRTKLQEMRSDQGNPVPAAELGVALGSAGALKNADLFEAAHLMAMQSLPNRDVAALSLLLAMSPRTSEDRSPPHSWDIEAGKLAVELVSRLQQVSPSPLDIDIILKIHQRLTDNNLPRIAQSLRRTAMNSSEAYKGAKLVTLWRLAEENQDSKLAHAILDSWLDIAGDPPTDSLMIELPDHFGRSMAMFCSLCDVAERTRLFQKFLRLKHLVPSPSGELPSVSDAGSYEVRWTKKTSHRLFESGRHVGSRNVITLPESVDIVQTDITFFVNVLHSLNDAEQLALIEDCERIARDQTDPYAIFIQRLAAAHLHCLRSEFDQAILQVIEAAAANPEAGYLRIRISAYHAENGDALSALNLLETVSPSDIDAYRQGLWLKLQIGSSTGKREIATQAATTLFGIRLTRNERRHLELITQRRQLGTTRAQSTDQPPVPLRPMEQLVNRMTAMQSAGEFDKAIEIANSILLTSDETQHTTRLATAARLSAIKLLGTHGRLEIALDDVSRRMKHNQNSADLLRLKLQILKGLERNSEAGAIETQLAHLVPQTPENWIQAGQDLEDLRDYGSAVDEYLKAFRVKPALLLADYYRYFKVFRRVDRLPDLADLLIEADLRQLRDNYFVVSELIDILLAQSNSEEVGRRSIRSGFELLNEAWKAFPSDRNYLLNNIQARRLWESQTVVDYICDSLIPDSPQQAFARPWLGLDSAPVVVEGEGLLCPLDRVLKYLKNKTAREDFRKRVIAGQEQFPNWLAGPYLEVALNQSDALAEQNAKQLMSLLNEAVEKTEDLLPPGLVATNLVRTLRGHSPAADGKLAEFFLAAMGDSQQTSQIPFTESASHLLAELQFAAGNKRLARVTLLKALRPIRVRAKSLDDPEAAWNYIHTALAVVDLLRRNRMLLDAVAVSREVSPNILTVSRGYQSNDTMDRSCQRMWQQAKQSVSMATAGDVISYLDGQTDDLYSGRSSELNLFLTTPIWGQDIRWENSEFLMILVRLAESDPSGSDQIRRVFNEMKTDEFSASLCTLAMLNQRSNQAEAQSAVRAFISEYSNAADKKVGSNAVMAWCLAERMLESSDDNHAEKAQWDDSDIQLLLNLSLAGSSEEKTSSVWRQCVLHQAAKLYERKKSTGRAVEAWQRSLDELVPPLMPRSTTENSPLKQTRRLLLGQ